MKIQSTFNKGYNISMIRGDTEIIKVVIKDSKGNNVPLVVGDIIYFTVKTSTETEVKILQKTVTSFHNGVALISITPSDTKNININPYTHYIYDIQLTRSNGDVKTIIPPSAFILEGDVTYE